MIMANLAVDRCRGDSSEQQQQHWQWQQQSCL
jgi:hypothetical protein